MRISDWSSDVCSSDLLILPSSGGALVFGMDWLPLIGRRTERTAYRAARQYKATHLVLDGPQAAAVGLAIVPSAHGDRRSGVSGTSVSVRVDLGGRRLINNKMCNDNQQTTLNIR